jgi:ribonucleotide reductase beta subunit family protein with ferritin-like domain
MFDWMGSSLSLTSRVIAFACVEGIFFSSAFAAIYWIKRRNVLQGLCKANEFIARDEALHTEFAVALYHELTKNRFERLPEKDVHDLISSAVDVSENFVREALQVDLIGMNADDMVDYVKCTSDVLATSLGYNPIYKVENPFNWMAVISLDNKTNFFESKVSEYSKQSEANFDFDLEAEF